MTPANTAGAWRPDGDFSDRPYAPAGAPWPDRGPGAERSSRPLRTGPARPARPADRLRAADARSRDAADFPRTPAPRRAAEPDRAAGRLERGHPEGRRPSDRRPVERRADDRRPEDRRPLERRPVARDGFDDDRGPSDRSAAPRGVSGPARPRPTSPAADGNGIRGTLAVAGMFLVTLAGAGVDSFVGIGLGLVTLVTLVAVTAIATLGVRRRDLLSVVVAPPLVFVAVAAANIALAPSASLDLRTITFLLVSGFPTMALATGVALVLGLVRLAARR